MFRNRKRENKYAYSKKRGNDNRKKMNIYINFIFG